MLHLGLPWDSSHKIFKHCTKTYVKTGLGNLVCPSHELSKVEQNLVEMWDLSSGLLVFTTACRYCRKLNSHELNRFALIKNHTVLPFSSWLKICRGQFASWLSLFLLPKIMLNELEAANLTSPRNFSSRAFNRKY